MNALEAMTVMIGLGIILCICALAAYADHLGEQTPTTQPVPVFELRVTYER